ncbi:hypothetical protein AB0H34_08255 [Saccharopolyspora shandongensis]|uniref:hypothetical protein n=1 Tax=Saccharopolyspora shandongensis TaxID=418495 RepID=UPI0033F37462
MYGLNTWLPQLMRQADYPLGSAIAFLLVFNVGAVLGGLSGAALADRFGGRGVATIGFAIAAASIALLAVPMPQVLLYLLIALSGATSVGTQIVVFGCVATYRLRGCRGNASPLSGTRSTPHRESEGLLTSGEAGQEPS